MPAHTPPIGTVSIQTQGCKLNQADTEKLLRRFLQAGYGVVGPDEPADVRIVNTCTVTHLANGKARQAIRSARRKDSAALVVATGCYAQRAPDELAALGAADLVVGNSDKDSLVEMVLAARGDPVVPSAAGQELPPSLRTGTFNRTRAMLKIQEGCDQVCAYCIVPKVRGRERTIPPDLLVEQVTERVRQGYKEVVLTGTQLGSYGHELSGPNLKTMLERLLRETGVQRLRVSSLQPQEISEELLKLWEDRRMCPHFHMPLQSGSTPVLRRMRRRYTKDQYALAVEMVRAMVKGVAVTADVIVGFPGEEETHFQETLRFAGAMSFASIHVFPFSTRPGTSAAHMGPQVDAEAKRRRMADMR